MKKSKLIILGISTTIVIFIISIFAGHYIQLPINFLAESFETHATMLLLSLIAIFLFKNQKLLSFPNKKFQFKHIWKPILFMILGFIIIQILVTVILLPFGLKSESNKLQGAIAELKPIEVFLFVVILASVAEEFLFRGFLQNILSPLKPKGIKIFKIKISLPVIISGIIFGLAHLILLTTGAEISFVIRTVFYTITVGLIAGYFYEKYDNILYAIITHSVANIPALIATLLF